MQKLSSNHVFLFQELVKRDFILKYKRTVLGMLWSVIGPLAMLGVLAFVFTEFFGRNIEHYIIYLFCGNLLFNYFKEATNTGMTALFANSLIFSKVSVPKYLFVLSKNTASLINFAINLVLLFLFMAIDGVAFTWRLFLLIFPVICLVVFNVGVSLILASLYMMFRDLKYLYDIVTMIIMYLSAIFYSIDTYPIFMQNLFYLNPLYVYIDYFRTIILDAEIPSLFLHIVGLFYALFFLGIGLLVYKKNNKKFLYYI